MRINLKSAVYTLPLGEDPVWARGKNTFGWVRVSISPLFNVIHCPAGTEPPDNSILDVVKHDSARWKKEDLNQKWANEIDVRKPADRRPEVIRLRQGAVKLEETVKEEEQFPEGLPPSPIDLLTFATIELIPHEWAGDGE